MPVWDVLQGKVLYFTSRRCAVPPRASHKLQAGTERKPGGFPWRNTVLEVLAKGRCYQQHSPFLVSRGNYDAILTRTEARRSAVSSLRHGTRWHLEIPAPVEISGSFAYEFSESRFSTSCPLGEEHICRLWQPVLCWGITQLPWATSSGKSHLLFRYLIFKNPNLELTYNKKAERERKQLHVGLKDRRSTKWCPYCYPKALQGQGKSPVHSCFLI